MEWRGPLVNNVNWYMLFKDHPGYSDDGHARVHPNYSYTHRQLKRAAVLMHGAAEYCRLLALERIAPEKTKFGPLCMHQNRRLFGVTRIPCVPYDKLVDCGFPPRSRNALVMVREHLWNVPVLDADSGAVMSPQAIYLCLEKCVQEACEGRPAPGVAILTAVDRDTWAAMRERLVSSLPVENGRAFLQIQDSLFGMSLDDDTGLRDIHAAAKHSLHGPDGTNRWFDKCLTLWVVPSGQSGGNGEHSPCDAVIPNQMMQHVLEHESRYLQQFAAGGEGGPDAMKGAVDRIEFVVTPEVLEAIAMARMHVRDSCRAMCVVEGRVKQFGSERIRQELGTQARIDTD